MVSKLLAVCAAAAVGCAHGAAYSAAHLQALKDAKCVNLAEVEASVGFTDPDADPYPKLGYDTTIDYSKKCYVVFPDEQTRSSYRLESWTDAQVAGKNVTTAGRGTVYKTHDSPCGVCSDLSSLSVYIGTPDLTSPVRACGLKLIEKNQIKCLEDIGFTNQCTRIWLRNTKNTKKTDAAGGCLGTCLRYATADNNEPKKSWFAGSNPCSPSECKNTINGKNACSNFQWENGAYRLNPCLQCDECRSGPIFQKVAGRTRRNTGLVSAINRPPESIVAMAWHGYGMPTATVRSSVAVNGAAVGAIASFAGVALLGAGVFARRRFSNGMPEPKEGEMVIAATNPIFEAPEQKL